MVPLFNIWWKWKNY